MYMKVHVVFYVFYNNVNNALYLVLRWLDANNLLLNTKKTKKNKKNK